MKEFFRKIFGEYFGPICADAKTAYRRFLIHWSASIRTAITTIDVLSYVCSFICLAALIVLIGFEHNLSSIKMIRGLMRTVQWVFTLNIVLNISLNYKKWRAETRVFKWIVDMVIVLAFFTMIYPEPRHPWFPMLVDILYSHKFMYLVLGAYSVVDLSYGVMKLMAHRLNPSLLMASSFMIFILIGSLLLMMPRSTVHGISYIDSLFVSTSAVSITGLTTLDVASTFTTLGDIILAVMLQIGGIGIITFTSFFAIFYSGNQSIHSQLLIKDMVYSKSMNDLGPTLLYIIGFTVTIETIGAAMIYFTIPPELGMDLESKILFAIFHSLSSFCNAGFSIIPEGMANPALMHGNQLIYIATSILIFAGAIGYPILVNLKDIFFNYLRRLWSFVTRSRRPHLAIHIYDLNTKLVFITTMSILVVSSVAFYFLESSNSMAGMSTYEKVVQSVFNSLTPRSAGFTSLNPATFLNVTLLIVILQMWIGGASQSMAGGVKVNTFAIVMLNLRAVIKSHSGAKAFNRHIALPSVRRANAVVMLSIVSLFILILLLMLCEPQLSAKDIIFEAISALFTVGSSMGITDQLCVTSKILLSIAMFVGRVGLISLLTGMFAGERDTSTLYPEENVIIN